MPRTVYNQSQTLHLVDYGQQTRQKQTQSCSQTLIRKPARQHTGTIGPKPCAQHRPPPRQASVSMQVRNSAAKGSPRAASSALIVTEASAPGLLTIASTRMRPAPPAGCAWK